MNKPDPICPQCNTNKDVYKVSEIYLSGLESIKSSTPLEDNAFDQIFGQPSQKLGRRFVDQATKRTLVSKFAPPSSKKQRITRTIPPDFIIFVTLLLSLFMLYQIYTQQQDAFLPVLLVIFGVTVFYLLTRKRILARYLEKQKTTSKESSQIKEGIARWMNLFYCSTDYVVFDANKLVCVPLEEMNNYLMFPEAFLGQSIQEE